MNRHPSTGNMNPPTNLPNRPPTAHSVPKRPPPAPSRDTGSSSGDNPTMNFIPDSQATQDAPIFFQEDTSMNEDSPDNSNTLYVTFSLASTPAQKALEDACRDLGLPVEDGDNVKRLRAKVIKHVYSYSNGIPHNIYELPSLNLGWSKIGQDGSKGKRLAGKHKYATNDKIVLYKPGSRRWSQNSIYNPLPQNADSQLYESLQNAQSRTSPVFFDSFPEPPPSFRPGSSKDDLKTNVKWHEHVSLQR
ncbi:hypothetical protein Q9L58_010610 [Maublancomyces gigas]|uniref:Uncharacterized protein n=1 Tax=Discina gigas TaxID=1032678 RepID=A0ABR3G3P8_9PEZI